MHSLLNNVILLKHVQVALKHWARIIKQWPVDRVRPEHVSFQKIMQTRIQNGSSPRAAAANVKSNEALVSPVEPPQVNNEKEMKQVNALYALLEDRFAKAYPIPASLRNPASNPTHYDDVVREMEEAPTRSWVGSLLNNLRGKLRFS